MLLVGDFKLLFVFMLKMFYGDVVIEIFELVIML